MRSFYRYFQLFSMDVCLGAVAAGVHADRILAAGLPVYFYAVLFFSVFAVYTLDHIFDARQTGMRAARDRYIYYYRNYRAIAALTAVAAAAALGLALGFLDRNIITGGLVVSGGVMAHLLLSQYTGSLPFMKEWSVAFYYTLGIWLAPFIMAPAVRPVHIIAVILFYLTVLASLFVFSWMEIEEDRRDGSHSVAVFLGKERTAAVIRLVFLLIALLVIVMGVHDYNSSAPGFYWLPSLIVMLVHIVLFSWPDWARQYDRYRILGDGVFVVYMVSYFTG